MSTDGVPKKAISFKSHILPYCAGTENHDELTDTTTTITDTTTTITTANTNAVKHNTYYTTT